MVFCDNCGHVLKPTAKFCGECGTALDTPQTDNSQNQTNYAPPPPQTDYAPPPPQTDYAPPPPPKQKRSMGKAKKFGIGLVILIVVFVVFGAVASSVSSGPTFTTPQLSEQEIKDSSIGFVQYNELLRNNDPYVGKIIEFSGEVRFLYGDNFLLQEPNRDQYIRVNYDDDECLIIRGDGIRVWGTVVGLDTYSTMMGKKTVPEVNALFMSRC
jgi:hypothetical protein